MLWKSRFLVFSVLTLSTNNGFSNELQKQREALLEELKQSDNLSDDQIKKLRTIVSGSTVLSQGNPAITKHPVSRDECLAQQKKLKIEYNNLEYNKICGSPHMAPLYDPTKDKPTDAKACIDQFEFPNQPCNYPVVWVRAQEAAQICEVMGKRLCDAHEWEGACDGKLLEPDYDFALAAKAKDPSSAIRQMRLAHNQKESSRKSWAYGAKDYTKGICGGDSTKASDCNGGDWKRCGSNTYPSGYFPNCKSPLGVYDQHGNAAEHMNLPTSLDEMASIGSKTLGHTEMKGSWFIFDKYKAHEDYCRWRAPYWHGSKVMHPKSHENYHLGFRCCKTIEKKPSKS